MQWTRRRSSIGRLTGVRRHGTQDYYEILSVTEDATDDEVRTAYLKLALKWHPDKHHGNDAATNKFQEISEAYHVLSDPVKRAE